MPWVSAPPSRVFLAALCVLALVATACTSGIGGSGGDIPVLDGLVERDDGDDDWVAVEGPLSEGDRIRVVDEAAQLGMGDGTVRLAPGTVVRIHANAVTLERGDVVIDAATTDVLTGEALVDGQGIFRVRTGVTPVVGVYAGQAQVVRPGEGQRLATYRELELTARRFDGEDRPLSYDADDPVDQDLLPRALAFDQEVARLTSAIDQRYGVDAQPAIFYASFVAVSEADLEALAAAAPRRDVDGSIGPAADALIGLFVARAYADREDISLLEAADRVADLRLEGARWGLVALVLDVDGLSFAGIVDQAVERREVVVAATAAQAPAATAPASGSRPATPSAAAAPPPASPAPAPAPAPPPPPPESQPPLIDVPDLIDDILDALPLDVSGALSLP